MGCMNTFLHCVSHRSNSHSAQRAQARTPSDALGDCWAPLRDCRIEADPQSADLRGQSTAKTAQASDVPRAVPVPAGANPKNLRQTRLSAQTLIDKRAALSVTPKQMAALLGVCSLSVCKWESGQVQPQAAQLQRIVEVLKLGKRQALAFINPQ